MANLNVKDAAGATKTLKATDNGGVLTPHHNVDSLPADPFGANADAAVVSDAAGSLSGKLRGLIKWSFERMPASLGQKTKANSLPVCIASDQDALQITGPVTASGTVTAAASENHIGQVGQKVALVEVTPTITAGAYSAGDCVGGVLSFANAVRVAAGGGELLSVTLTDLGKQDAEIDLVLFDANPSVAPSDGDACSIADADLVHILGVVTVAAADYADFADNSVGVKTGGPGVKLPAGTTLYGVLVTRGTPTYTSTSDLTVRLAIRQG